MSRYMTGNPLGSDSPLDRDDNTKNLDVAINSKADMWTDRLGVPRPTLKAAIDPTGLAHSAAQSSRDAQLAKDAAINASRLFSTVAKGLAGTSEDGIFSVPGEGKDLIAVYRKENGAAVKIAETPSSLVTAELSSLIKESKQNGIFAQIIDALGFARWIARDDGGFGTEDAYLAPGGIYIQGYGKGVTIGDGEFVLAEWGPDGLSTELSPSLVGPGRNGMTLSIRDSAGFYGLILTDHGFDAHGLKQPEQQPSAEYSVYPAPVTPGSEIVSHRGLHADGIAPENSLDAYRLAGLAGYEYVETDIRPTSDRQFVLMHDHSINRTMRKTADYGVISETVNVDQVTLTELRENYVLASTDPAMRRPIPTLEEFLITCREYRLYPVIEFSGVELTNAEINGVLSTAIKILGENGFAFTAGDSGKLDYIRTQSSLVSLWYIRNRTPQQILENAPSVSYVNRSDATTAYVQECRALGVPVGCWTISNADFERYAGGRFCDFIATDYIAPATPAGVPIYALRDLGELETTGRFENGVLMLSEGETAVLPRSFSTQALSAAYLRLGIDGDFSISTNQLNEDYSYSESRFYQAQTLIISEFPVLKITGGANGARLRSIEYTLTKTL